MTKKKEEKHNKHYWEDGRNGYYHNTTLDTFDYPEQKEQSVEADDKMAEDLKVYTKTLEGYVNDMEGYLLKNNQNKNCDAGSCDNFSIMLDEITLQLTNLLKEKNKAYGNTALNPPNIFSKLSSTEAICARLDDKLSRIQNRGINDATEDTVDDVIGYLLLLKMSMVK
tara:strand:+ start:271 stop:774 length:504 start_codon:yes stop_codon:yes gene_type:complete